MLENLCHIILIILILVAIFGLAFTSGACKPFEQNRARTSRVALVEDHAAYNEITGVAHEMGHL